MTFSRVFSRRRAVASALIAGILATSGLIVPAPSGAVRAASQTLLVARDISDGKTMDPGRFYEFTSNAVATNCYDTLVTFSGGNTSTPQKDLADRWTIANGGRVFTFYLRHDVRFASGHPLTAADVVFSYNRLKYLNDNPSFLISGATEIHALDKYTVRITLGAPDVSFLAALATNNFGVLDSQLVIAHGGDASPDAAKKDKATTFLDGQTVGTGAFQMTNWTRNVQIALERNPTYWGPRAPMDKIIFQNQKSAATQRLLVQRGSVDVAMNVDLQQAQALQHDPNTQLVTGNTLDLIYIGMTTSMTRSVELADKRVRQAVRYAIDYDGILKGLLKGVGTRPNGMIPVGMLGNSTPVNNSLLLHRDLAKARALLKAAGYANGFSIKLSYDTNTTFDGVAYDPIASKLQNDLAQVGIKVTLEPQQDSVLLPAYRGQKLQMILYNWGVDFPDPHDYAGPFSPGGGPAKRMFYTKNTTLADLVSKADAISDASKRAALYRTIQQTWLDEGPWIGLVQPQNIIVFSKGLKGYVYSPVFPSNFRTVSR